MTVQGLFMLSSSHCQKGIKGLYINQPWTQRNVWDEDLSSDLPFSQQCHDKAVILDSSSKIRSFLPLFCCTESQVKKLAGFVKQIL